MKVNFNKMAMYVAKHEGGKKQVDIAQIKEVIKYAFEYAGEHHTASEFLAIWDKYN